MAKTGGFFSAIDKATRSIKRTVSKSVTKTAKDFGMKPKTARAVGDAFGGAADFFVNAPKKAEVASAKVAKALGVKRATAKKIGQGARVATSAVRSTLTTGHPGVGVAMETTRMAAEDNARKR